MGFRSFSLSNMEQVNWSHCMSGPRTPLNRPDTCLDTVSGWFSGKPRPQTPSVCRHLPSLPLSLITHCPRRQWRTEPKRFHQWPLPKISFPLTTDRDRKGEKCGRVPPRGGCMEGQERIPSRDWGGFDPYGTNVYDTSFLHPLLRNTAGGSTRDTGDTQAPPLVLRYQRETRRPILILSCYNQDSSKTIHRERSRSC